VGWKFVNFDLCVVYLILYVIDNPYQMKRSQRNNNNKKVKTNNNKRRKKNPPVKTIATSPSTLLKAQATRVLLLRQPPWTLKSLTTPSKCQMISPTTRRFIDSRDK